MNSNMSKGTGRSKLREAAAHLQTANLPDDVKTLAINAIEFQLFMGVIMGYMDNVTVSKTRHELLPVDD